jgi:hypothetical protein
MTFEGVAAIALGIIAIVAPEWVPKMRKGTRNAITALGFLLLGYSGILALEEATGMKLQTGPLLTIIAGIIIVAAGVFWHVHLSMAQAPPAVAQLQPGAPSVPSNTMGPVTGNQGIVTQGQSGGQNVIINPRITRHLDDAMRAGLLKDLPKDKPVLVLGMNGNTESMNYAKEIYAFLKDNDYPMKDKEAGWHMFFNPPVFNVNISDGNNGTERLIVVGPAE